MTPPFLFPNIEGAVIIGSGNYDACSALVHSLLWSDDSRSSCTSPGNCAIDGMEIPELEDLHFFGMVLALCCVIIIPFNIILQSAYFYALDAVRTLGPVEISHWYALISPVLSCLFCNRHI